MQRRCVFAGLALALALPPAAHALTGADLSSLPRVAAVDDDLLEQLKARGLDTVRLRVWHSPPDGACSLPEMAALAGRVHAAGLDLLLDLHYSDTWADPGHQAPPRAWQGLPVNALADSVRAYTRDVMRVLAARGVAPACVQVGNEITGGFLWDTGRVGGAFDTPRQWDNLALLLRAGIAGMDDGLLPGAARPAVMLHIDNAGNRHLLDGLARRGVLFDVIGVSYYPWWHGDLSTLESNLRDLSARYGKRVVVVETAYPWTLQWFDDTHNLVGQESQLLPGYPATPEGQARFLAEVTRIAGGDVVWWEPAWAGPGSAWENMGWVDGRGRLFGGPGGSR